MKAEDIVVQLAALVPVNTDRLTRNVSVLSMVRSGTSVTVNCSSPHGGKLGGAVVITGSKVPIAITSLTRAGTQGTMVLATNHDLTPKTNKQVVISGANEAEFNGTFTIDLIQDDMTILFDMVDSGPTVATGSPILENGESALRTYDGAYAIKQIPSATIFVIDHPTTSLANPIGDIQAKLDPRVTAAADPDRMIEAYTEQENLEDLWACIVLGDVVASKDRRILSDAVDDQPTNVEFRQQIIQPFSVYLLFSVGESSISGREARDISEEMFRPICQSLLRARFDSGLYVGKHGTVQFVNHGVYRYDASIYVHFFNFQQVVDIYFEDTVGADLDVAFRCIDLELFPDHGTQLVSMDATILLDEPE